MCNLNTMTTVLTFSLMLAILCQGESSLKGGADNVLNVKTQSVSIGTWGGSGIRIDVRKKGARVEFDCAHGTIPGTLKTDGSGRFDYEGLIEFEHGGPIHEGGQGVRRTARYVGRVERATMDLTVTLLDTGESIGRFTLVRGKSARITKCM